MNVERSIAVIGKSGRWGYCGGTTGFEGRHGPDADADPNAPVLASPRGIKVLVVRRFVSRTPENRGEVGRGVGIFLTRPNIFGRVRGYRCREHNILETFMQRWWPKLPQERNTKMAFQTGSNRQKKSSDSHRAYLLLSSRNPSQHSSRWRTRPSWKRQRCQRISSLICPLRRLP